MLNVELTVDFLSFVLLSAERAESFNAGCSVFHGSIF